MKPPEPEPSNGSTSILDLLSLLAPRRLLLVGPDGPLLRAAVRWAAEHAGVDVLRAREADDAAVGDLIVCQDARRLPPDAAAGARALLPEDQAAQAAEYGWPKIDSSAGGAVLLGREGSPDVGLEQGLGSYTRRRLTLSSRWRDLAMRLARSEYSPVSGAAASVTEAPTRFQPPSLTGQWCPPESPLLSIIVPVYNAAAELRRCLNSLARHTTWPAELVLIDDASPDPKVADVLAEALALHRTRVLRNAVNLGFTETVNRGLRATRGDVVLLNSDTEVGPRWLEHLLRAAESRERVATVTAISDNAGAFSVPRVGERNPTPLWLDAPDVARLLAQETSIRGQGPTGGGFCMYISRRSIDAVGQFDAEAFPRGYGEENYFCMRALRDICGARQAGELRPGAR
jgi:hypothetical protein